ncbi:MAG: protein jag [Spirochaetaceae bacterium]|jgi:spoIIIJ-associated protein|nr:protein jag [Spirochaetaceae bacterium]
MVFEFEGKTEKEAIEKAMYELGIERDSFDVEILEVRRGGFLKRGNVKIRLHLDDKEAVYPRSPQKAEIPADEDLERTSAEPLSPEEDAAFEARMLEFLRTLIKKMGMGGNLSVRSRERKKLVIGINTNNSAILIGKQGRTLDALQLIATIYAKKIIKRDTRIMLDCENYRRQREDALVRLAHSVADRVRLSRRSVLLEPMNSYDRKLIHTTLEASDVSTESEGSGLYKQIRVSYRG